MRVFVFQHLEQDVRPGVGLAHLFQPIGDILNVQDCCPQEKGRFLTGKPQAVPEGIDALELALTEEDGRILLPIGQFASKQLSGLLQLTILLADPRADRLCQYIVGQLVDLALAQPTYQPLPGQTGQHAFYNRLLCPDLGGDTAQVSPGLGCLGRDQSHQHPFRHLPFLARMLTKCCLDVPGQDALRSANGLVVGHCNVMPALSASMLVHSVAHQLQLGWHHCHALAAHRFICHQVVQEPINQCWVIAHPQSLHRCRDRLASLIAGQGQQPHLDAIHLGNAAIFDLAHRGQPVLAQAQHHFDRHVAGVVQRPQLGNERCP